MKRPKAILKKHRVILDELEELFDIEHGGCDSSTCNISVAFDEGYTIHAIECFSNSGATSDEFNTLYNKLPRRLVNNWSRYEADLMCKDVSHAQCPHCNAVSWHIEALLDHRTKEVYCSSCDKTFKEVVNE